MFHTQVKNSKGEPIVLHAMEKRQADYLYNQIKNSLGYEVDITTLTAISKRVVEQKFFQIAPADFMPVRVGEGAWSTEILTYRDFAIGGDFETGLINTAANKSRMAEADSAVDSISVQVLNWAKEINWTIFDLAHASKSGNWDLVSSKERARKKNWDLGIQKIAFLGSASNSGVRGLLTQSDVNSNTALITKYINAMSDTEFEALLQGIMEAYRANADRTAMPTHFVIPEADYNGLAVSTSEDFPLVSKLERLQKAFAMITQNQGFKILPLAYADEANNADTPVDGKNRYVLYNYDEDSGRMDIPVDYTNTMQNTVNGAQFTNVGYGQFTGFKAYRPKEFLYLDWAS
jgi:hypothetical protein